MLRNDDRIREIRKIRFKTMKLDLLGSAETHRGTRWTYNWAFAVREAQAGEFEFSEKRRGTRRPIIFNHRDRKLKSKIRGRRRHYTTCDEFQKLLEASKFCSIEIQAF
ncbi:hypothetical protein E3N88_06362 [Mikania micrantha]|uniref:Uncharacterized protein n=1 Tax=Mikania micrantha TaxID=192012 RepID=A0A5N6PPS2_9ASTR|nr:hypothetical protein E3N88_06362 [Mikania micrantha]